MEEKCALCIVGSGYSGPSSAPVFVRVFLADEHQHEPPLESHLLKDTTCLPYYREQASTLWERRASTSNRGIALWFWRERGHGAGTGRRSTSKTSSHLVNLERRFTSVPVRRTQCHCYNNNAVSRLMKFNVGEALGPRFRVDPSGNQRSTQQLLPRHPLTPSCAQLLHAAPSLPNVRGGRHGVGAWCK